MNGTEADRHAGWSLVRYRLRTTWRAALPGYLTIVILTGLLGGLALGSLVAARKTDSSFTVLWDSTNPSQLEGAIDVLNPLIGSTTGYDAARIRTIRGLPHVQAVSAQAGIDFLPLQRNGSPLNAPNFYPPAAGNGNGSVDGEYFTQDRAIVTQGRMADPRRADEFMTSAAGAAALYLHVGDVLPIGIYTNAQTTEPGFGTSSVKPIRVIDERLTGIILLSTSLLEDDVDAGTSPYTLFTPALTDQLLSCCVNYSGVAVKVAGGEANAATVEAEIQHVLPTGFPPLSDAKSYVLDNVQRSLKPEGIALGAFGGIVALAALFIVGQVVGRQTRAGSDDRAALRALGAGPTATTFDGVAGIVGAVSLGVLVAGAVCVALSALAPLGPVGVVYPYPGVSFDWTVLGFGMAALLVALAATTVAVALLGAPHRLARRRSRSDPRPTAATQAAARLGVPIVPLTGLHFALEPGSGRNSVPVRSVILGSVVAVVVVVATVTFGSSFHSLVNHPALYGWNWDEALVSGGDIPQQQAATMLDADRSVAQWAGIYTADLFVDGQVTAVLGERPGASPAPPVLSGHGLQGADQIVLGPVTLAQLHKHVGDTVVVTSGLLPPVRLTIVGTTTPPVLGGNGGPHLEMGTGAVLPWRYLPAPDRNPFDNPITGPNAIFVNFRPGVNHAAAVKSLDAIAQATSNTANFGDVVSPVQRPAEIVNYRSLGNVPLYLGSGLAVGSVAGLALTLVASVRRRRHDMALLKTLGFTRRQFMAVVAWQATTAMVVGVVVGVPLGVALGRWLWDLFARNIHAVPLPVVPALVVAAVGAGSLVLANLVSLIPGRMAANTATATLLKSE